MVWVGMIGEAYGDPINAPEAHNHLEPRAQTQGSREYWAHNGQIVQGAATWGPEAQKIVQGTETGPLAWCQGRCSHTGVRGPVMKGIKWELVPQSQVQFIWPSLEGLARLKGQRLKSQKREQHPSNTCKPWGLLKGRIWSWVISP